MLNTKVTLKEAIEKVWTMEWANQKDGKNSKSNVTVFANWFGYDQYVNTVSTETMREFKFHCKSKLSYSEGTINRKLASVSKILTFAKGLRGFQFEWGSPMVEYYRENNKRDFVFTTEMEDKLIMTSKVMGYGDKCDLWVCLIETGCRLSEWLNAKWEDIDDSFVYFSDTKNGDNRYVPIFDKVKDILAKRKERGFARPFPYSLSSVENCWKKIRRAMGMEGEKHFVIHSLRHTCITRLLRRKVGIEVVQKIVGHKDIRMTQRYNHPTKDDLRQAVKAV
jgi:integrase